MDRAYSLLQIRSVDDDARVIRGTATTVEPDRMGDVIEPLGAKFKNPLPLLWQHRSDQPVGTVKFDKPTKSGIGFEAHIAKIADAGTLKDRVDEAWQSVKAGLVRAVSIGFRSLEHSFMEGGGIRFMATEILELSLVTIPANASATIASIKSIDTELRAASSRQRMKGSTVVPPGAPGFVQPKSTPKEGKMNIAEQIRALRTERDSFAEKMKAFGDVTSLDDVKTAEYDAIADDFEKAEKDLTRLERMQRAMGESVEVRGDSQAGGSASRQGVRPAFSSARDVSVELPKGTRFARYAMAIAAGRGSVSDALQYAKRWERQTPEVGEYIRSVAGTSQPASPGWGSELVFQNNLASEFIELLMPATIIGRIDGFRRVPFNVRIATQTGGADTVNWVGEGAPKPIGELVFDEITLPYHKIAGIVVISEELVRLSAPSAEQTVRNDLVRQISRFMDEQFLDSSITATSTRPAAVTQGISAVAATGTDADALYSDLNAALADFDNAEFNSIPVAITTRAIARGISTLRNALGQFEFTGVNPQGGTLNGMTLIVSNSCPAGFIYLINPGEILLADDGGVRLDASNQATLDMSSSTNATYSLWQNNMIGLRAERWITYKKRRAEAVAGISGAAYGPTESSP